MRTSELTQYCLFFFFFAAAPAKATDALTKGLKDLEDACDVMTEKFIAARDEFMSRQEKADTGGATMQA